MGNVSLPAKEDLENALGTVMDYVFLFCHSLTGTIEVPSACQGQSLNQNSNVTIIYK